MKKILFDARLLIKGGASGIEGYTRSLFHTLLSIDKDHKYELFYNGFRKVPLTEFLERGALVHDWRIPRKFFGIGFNHAKNKRRKHRRLSQCLTILPRISRRLLLFLMKKSSVFIRALIQCFMRFRLMTSSSECSFKNGICGNLFFFTLERLNRAKTFRPLSELLIS